MIRVRPADAGDRDEILRILAASPEAGSWAGLEWTPPRQCLVAEIGSRPAGVLVADCPAEEEAEILTLVVDPAARRQGVGRALLRGFLKERRGRVWLEVRRSNRAARRLYESCGFVKAGVRRGYYQSPGEDAVVMRFTAG